MPLRSDRMSVPIKFGKVITAGGNRETGFQVTFSRYDRGFERKKEFMVVYTDMDFIALMPVTAAVPGVMGRGGSAFGLEVLSQGYAPCSVFMSSDRQVLTEKNQAAHQEINEEQSCCRF